MKRFRIVLVAVVVLLFVGWIALYRARSREPRYQNRTLTQWLEAYQHAFVGSKSDTNAPAMLATSADAVKQIGTNAIPVLLKMIRTHDSSLAHTTILLLRKQSLIHLTWRTDSECQSQACLGFRLLGLSGKPAVGELTDLALTAPDPAARASAARALNSIVPEVDRLDHRMNMEGF
jgi:hypothetical protein